MNILGISAFYHDSAAALVRDGRLVAAASEERFTRVKHDAGFPANAVRFCLDEAGLTATDLDYIGFYDKPFLKMERLLKTYLACFPAGLPSFLQAIPIWLREKLWIRAIILERLGLPQSARERILFAEHHESHAASAFLVSPFEEAAILTVDGVGEWATTTRGRGQGASFTIDDEIVFPHSLGLLYSAFTYYLGFKVNSAEYKVMGLAPYGEPKYVDKVRELIDVKQDGSFRLNMDYFAYPTGLRMTNRRFSRLFGHPVWPREARPDLLQMDIAASVQAVTNDVMLKLARGLKKTTGLKNLCMAGGVALNCVANGLLLRESGFEDIWIQPAAGDAGGALGVAFLIENIALGRPRRFALTDAAWGPAYSTDEIRATLNRLGAVYEELDEPALIEGTVDRLCDQKVVGWFQGRMEFGPRALGRRSILGDPRNPEMQSTMNLKIKFRESFRPFAPSVLHEKAGEWFDFDAGRHASPFMLFVSQVAPGRFDQDGSVVDDDPRRLQKLSEIPAVTHVDGSARLQTVRRRDNPLYHDLISAFDRRTGCPVVINTSFNVRGEPIVCSPEDAWACFMRSNMDALVIDRFLLDKKSQPQSARGGARPGRFSLD